MAWDKTAQFQQPPCVSLNLTLLLWSHYFYDQNIALVYSSLLLFIFQQSQDEVFPSEAQFLLEDQKESHELKEHSGKGFYFPPKLQYVEPAPL